jgi:hypothetical protein
MTQPPPPGVPRLLLEDRRSQAQTAPERVDRSGNMPPRLLALPLSIRNAPVKTQQTLTISHLHHLTSDLENLHLSRRPVPHIQASG